MQMIHNKDEDNGFSDESPTWKARLKVIFRKPFNQTSKREVTIKAFSKFRAENVIRDIFDQQKKNLDYRIMSLEHI